MIRLTVRQFRMQTAVAVAALCIVALALAITGSHLVNLYDSTVANCMAQGDCQAATAAFLRNDSTLQAWLGPILLVVPGIIGVFWGAPLIARELETGTFRLVWTQSVSRTRWFVVKLGVIGLTTLAVAGVFSLMVTWWFGPLDKVNLNRFTPGVFDERGIVAIGYAAFAFTLGVTVGVLIRRTLPAMATTLIIFVGARLAMTQWIRPHLIAPAHTSLPITSAPDLGFTPGPSGVTFVAGTPSISNAWVVSSRIVDQAGHTATAQVLHQFLQTACPTIASPQSPTAGLSRAPANQTTFQSCITQLSAKFHVAVTYQPASRYWTFQGYEMGIFLALALLLAGVCFWWVRHRIA